MASCLRLTLLKSSQHTSTTTSARKNYRIGALRQSSFEVDFVIGDDVAIETKTTKLVNENKDLRGLRALKEEGIFKKYIVVSRDNISRTTDDGIMLLPWNLFLDWLWEGKII